MNQDGIAREMKGKYASYERLKLLAAVKQSKKTELASIVECLEDTESTHEQGT